MKSKSKKKIRILEEKSCGVVLFQNADEQRLYLLLHYPGGHWDFPKGHVEERDRSEEETACRELEEETGITDIELTSGFRDRIYYEFWRGREVMVKKTVIYFLARARSVDVKISFEHQNFIWLPFHDALQKLTFQNAKDLLSRGEQHLQGKKL